MIKEFQGEYRWLSNFWSSVEHPVIVEYEGKTYETVEKAYQAAKTENLELRDQISRLDSPGKAKRFYRDRKGDIRSDWNDINVEIMEDLTRQKFSEDYYKRKLLATGDEEIQEGNYWGDSHWGVDLKTGRGENRLGKIIMKVREELADELSG